MKPIFKSELKDRKNSLIAYCAIALGLVILYTALFPSIKASSEQLQKLIEAYPKGVYQALGIEELSFNTLEKFLSVELFSLTWPLIALLLAISRAGGTFAGEVERGTMGLYLALPISRTKLFLSKYFSQLTAIAIFILVSVIGIVPVAMLFNQSINTASILSLSLLCFLFLWSIFSMTSFFSAQFSERSKVYMFSGGIILVMYVANVVAELRDNLNWLHNFSIFHYFTAQDVLHGRSIGFASFAVFIISITIFTLLGNYVFNKRDIAV